MYFTNLCFILITHMKNKLFWLLCTVQEIFQFCTTVIWHGHFNTKITCGTYTCTRIHWFCYMILIIIYQLSHWNWKECHMYPPFNDMSNTVTNRVTLYKYESDRINIHGAGGCSRNSFAFGIGAVVEDRFLCRHVGANFIPTATIVDKTMVRK